MPPTSRAVAKNPNNPLLSLGASELEWPGRAPLDLSGIIFAIRSTQAVKFKPVNKPDKRGARATGCPMAMTSVKDSICRQRNFVSMLS